MRYFLSRRSVLKWLEAPSLYDIGEDELYELDDEAFTFLKGCATEAGCAAENADPSFLEFCLSQGILTAEPVKARRSTLLQSPLPSLRYLELQITDDCNLRCRHCYVGKPGKSELTVEELKGVLQEFEEMQGLRLLITGGEPLTHRCFKEFNLLLPDYAFRKILFTNGLLLTTDLLSELNTDEIQFSVDGMEHGHEALRGKGTYRKVMERLRVATDAGVDVSVATMIHRENLGEFEEMQSLFGEMGIKDWTVDAPCLSGNFRDNLLLQVPPDVAGQYLKYGFGGGLHGGGEGFACGLHLVSVLATGKIAKCGFYAHASVGTLKEGLRRSWEKIRPVRLEELECSSVSCRFIDLCRGGCRHRASTTSGYPSPVDGALGRDLYKCHEYGIINSPEHEAPAFPEKGR